MSPGLNKASRSDVRGDEGGGRGGSGLLHAGNCWHISDGNPGSNLPLADDQTFMHRTIAPGRCPALDLLGI